MMKSEIRELIADIKAAVRIGHPESLQVALDGYRILPEVAGNAMFNLSFIRQTVLPLGEVLAYPRLDMNHIETLLDDPLSGVRALGAVAFGVRFLEGQGVDEDDLRRPGRDQRPEVRMALGEALAKHAQENQPLLLALVSDWLGYGVSAAPSARLRLSALIALRGLISDYGDEVLPLLADLPVENERETRSAHIETLVSAAESGRETAVYELLATWGAEPEPDTWMIAKTLSSAWAVRSPAEAEAILHALETKVGEDRAIDRAKRALARHGKSD
jgi:hypothetical protein